MAAGIANNPVLYATYKIAGLLDTALGGLPIPMISVMGNTVDLHTTVADLMRVAAMSGGIMEGLGAIISNSSAGGGFNGAGIIKSLEAHGDKVVRRGSGISTASGSGYTVSESGMVGNGDGGAIKDKTMAEASKDSQDQLISAQEDENQDIERKVVNDSIQQIYGLLEELVDGTKSLKVADRSSNMYGLAWTK